MAGTGASQARPGNTNGCTHGIYSVIARGSAGLPDTMRARELEMVENLATYQGVMQELERQALHQLMIVETGVAYLAKIGVLMQERGQDGNYWQVKQGQAVLRMLGSWVNGTVRTLEKLAQLRGDKDVVDMPTIMAGGKDAG